MKKLILLLSLFFFLISSAQERKEINTDTKTENIEKQISDLQEKIKVLEEQQLDKSKETENTYKNNMDFVEKVEGFYERSWNKLINLIGWVATMTGIIVPISIGWLQNKNFDRLETNGEKLQKQLKESSDNFQKQLDEIEQKFEGKLQNKIFDTEQNLIKLYREEYSKLEQQVSGNIMKMNEKLYNEINHARYFSFLTQADININNKDFARAVNCLGTALKICLKNINSSSNNFVEGILFVIEKIEKIIDFVSEKEINIDLSPYKELKEDILKSLKNLLTTNILPKENERIQKIIDFIKNH